MDISQNTISATNIASAAEIIKYAREKSVINMAENHSAIECPTSLEAQLKEHILPFANAANPKYGLLELREALSKKVNHLYDFDYDAQNEISITGGARQSVFASILALVKEGDEVVMFEPAHQNYKAAIETVGGRPVFVTLKAPNFEVDWSDAIKVIRPNTKMIIINTPHYPTGFAFSELDMLRLQKVINGTNIIILSDESYEHILFDNEMHQSVSMYPKLRKQSIIVSSFNESLHIPNWNIGYCMAPEKLMKNIRKTLSSMTDGVSLPYQMAIAKHIDPTSKYPELASIYQKKHELFCKGLEDSNIKVIPSKGSYFQLINIENISPKYDIDFAIELLEEHNLATMPISFYYHQKAKSKFLRLNLSVSDDTIKQAIDILKKY